MVPPIQNGMSMKKKSALVYSEYTISNSACASWRWTSVLEPPDNFAMYSAE